MAASTLALAGLSARPREGGDVAAVFPPWIGAADAFGRVAAAGGAVIRAGAIDTILVGHSDQPGFASRLHAAGAWLVLDPVAFGGCLLRNSNSTDEDAS